jgi:hypothetical protein
MTADELLAELDMAATNAPSADARRMIRDEASTLRARLQKAEQAAVHQRAIEDLRGVKGDQAEMQRRDSLRSIERLGDIDVAAQMREAKRVMEMWRNA